MGLIPSALAIGKRAASHLISNLVDNSIYFNYLVIVAQHCPDARSAQTSNEFTNRKPSN